MSPSFESFLYHHALLASFTGIGLLLLVLWGLGWIYFHIKLVRDRPYEGRRNALQSATFELLSGLPVASFALSVNTPATHVDISCVTEPAYLPELTALINNRLARLQPPAAATIRLLSDSAFQKDPAYGTHLLLHQVVTCPHTTTDDSSATHT